jgi:signal transduction histidine kinase
MMVYIKQTKIQKIKKLGGAVMNNLSECVVIPFIRTFNNNVLEVSEDINRDEHLSKDINHFSNKFEMNDELFITMSHEFKTPLNVIYGAAQLMESILRNGVKICNNENFIRNINSIKKNCYRLNRIVGNILDLNKIELNTFKLNLSNNDIVEEFANIVQAVSSVVKQNGLNITFNSLIKEKFIACDAEQIERVLLNLISNAVKFSKADGNIFVNLADKGDFIEVEVKDDGIGMNEQFLEEIFNKYCQENNSLSRIAEGSGIGLFLAKAIVVLHGGNISVKSEIGIGSSFKFTIPSKILNIKNDENKIIIYDNKEEMINTEFSDISIDN